MWDCANPIPRLTKTPDGFDAWVHFSVIEMDGYRFLDAGDAVGFGYEAAQQDSFRFVATRVRKL
jgi:CspA family cold shock protein